MDTPDFQSPVQSSHLQQLSAIFFVLVNTIAKNGLYICNNILNNIQFFTMTIWNKNMFNILGRPCFGSTCTNSGFSIYFFKNGFKFSGIVAEKTNICNCSASCPLFYQHLLKIPYLTLNPLHQQPSFERYGQKGLALLLNHRFYQVFQ